MSNKQVCSCDHDQKQMQLIVLQETAMHKLFVPQTFLWRETLRLLQSDDPSYRKI